MEERNTEHNDFANIEFYQPGAVVPAIAPAIELKQCKSASTNEAIGKHKRGRLYEKLYSIALEEQNTRE